MKRDALIIISVLAGILILALIFAFSFGNLNKTISGNPISPTPFNISKNPFEKGTLVKGCEEGVCIKEKKILIFVDNKIYSQLGREINRFSLDIKNDLNSDVIIFWDLWNDPKSIKNIIMNNKDNLYGIFLIGDLPYVKFARAGDPKLQWVSDFYYSDINNNCLYNESYNFYDVETCAFSGYTYGPWVARIKPNNKVNKIQAIKDYFNKNHDYRMGLLNYSPKYLYYDTINSDYKDVVNSDLDYICLGGLYCNDSITSIILPLSNPDLINSISLKLYEIFSKSKREKLRTEFLTKIREPYEFVYINAHGWYGGHEWDISTKDILNQKSNSLFYKIESCSVGNFGHDDYAASSYVFSKGNTLLALASTTDHFGFNFQYDDSQIMFLLSRGVSFADAFSTKFEVYSTWIGDPTLRLRQDVEKRNANIVINQTYFDLGKISSDGVRDIEIPFTITNIGTNNLIFNSISDLSSDRKFGYYSFFTTDFFDYTSLNPNETYNAKVIVRYIFAEDPITHLPIKYEPGKYEFIGFYIISNTDNNPMIPVTFSFEVVN